MPHPRKWFRVGPGLLVTAAFIGPGTVVTASKAGAQFGCQLLWTILFACIGTIVLQSLAARVGIITGTGLGESIRRSLNGSHWLRPAIALVIAAIGIGNAAYQTGNLTGAVTGIASITGGGTTVWVVALAALTTIIVSLGRYRILHGVLVSLVVLLSLLFLWTALSSLPSAERIAHGLLVPTVTGESLSLVIGLIGTTIVPYNLFLHASGAASTPRSTDQRAALIHSQWDTALSILLGGLVTVSIVLTASSAFFDTHTPWSTTDQIAEQLRPTLGRASGIAFALGLFGAGLTSSITAPVATAYAICGSLGWQTRPSSLAFRAIAISVIVIGASLAIYWGSSPTATILFAQVANGLLLPIVAIFLLHTVRHTGAAGSGRMRPVGLIAAWLVTCLVAVLGAWRVISALGSL